MSQSRQGRDHVHHLAGIAAQAGVEPLPGRIAVDIDPPDDDERYALAASSRGGRSRPTQMEEWAPAPRGSAVPCAPTRA